MKKWLIRVFLILLFAVGIGSGYVFTKMRDRHPGYKVDLSVQDTPEGALQVGFAKQSITPEVPDRWTDANDNAQYDAGEGDTFTDGNNNGHFDPVWIAGFQNRRPANGVHDTLWARAMVIDDGTTRLALVVLDAIGYGADDIIAVRKLIPDETAVDYTIVSSTHSHEAPDLLGLWGESEFKSGLDPDYRKFVQEQAAEAVKSAVAQLRPAKLRFAEDLSGAQDLVTDSRKPTVLDPAIRLVQAVDIETTRTLGVLFAWSNHPETLWNKNLLLSSDFPHFLRQGIENGVHFGDSTVMQGLGGTAIFINGSIGGLMTTPPEFGIRDPFLDTTYLEPSFDKARAQGEHLALLGLKALQDTTEVVEVERSAIQLRAKTFTLPLANPLYRAAAIMGVLDRGTSSWMKIRSEVCYWKLGPAGFLHQPGEIYPEIVMGGIEAPEGQDFSLQPIETPPLMDLMDDDIKFVIGLSNDMIGYIIPKSEWDAEPPFLYGASESPYGEINSVGPETGPIIYRELTEILKDLNE